MKLKSIIIPLFVGLVGLSLGYSIPSPKLTPAKYHSCVESTEVQSAVITQMYKEMGISKELLLQNVESSQNIESKDKELIKNQIEEAFKKDAPEEFALSIFIKCMNK